MIFPLLQIALIATVAFYLGRWRVGVRRRNTQSWDSLLARLRPDWSARELSDHFLWKEGLNASPEDAWKRMEGPHGLWAIYQNARVMLEMADFASRNCAAVDRELVETLRSDAMQIRVCVLMALSAVRVQPGQRRSPRECFPGRLNVHRNGCTDDSASAGECCDGSSRFCRRHVSLAQRSDQKPRLRPGFLFVRISLLQLGFCSRNALIRAYSSSLSLNSRAGAISSTCCALRPPTIAAVMAG